MTRQEPLEEILMRAGLLDDVTLARTRETQQRDGGSLGKALVSLGVADEETVVRAIADAMHLEHPDLSAVEVPAATVAMLPAAFCRKRQVAPLAVSGRSLSVAMVDPLDYSTIQDIEFRTNLHVAGAVAGQSALETLLDRLYPAAPAEQSAFDLITRATPTGEVEATEVDYETADISKLAKDTKLPPIVRLVNVLLSDAARAGASDIHVEPQESWVQVRQRMDGLLHDVLKIPKNLQDPTISRIKIISGMDIAERRKPQDGRSRLRFEGSRVDLRVSTLPTQFGEKVVIRLLDNRSAHIDMAQLGMSPANELAYRSLLGRPQGLLLVTGPTGSGKTSTLYASLNILKSSVKNIVTVEDPIEFQIPGISQVQINSRAGMTFATGLRSILRQDPNIVLVGEIRDRETAGIAMEAAQTGHLLLSTMHTNDAPGSITRLTDLDVEPFLISSSLIGILAQRLVRRVCTVCAVARDPGTEELEKVPSSALPAAPAWRAGPGCDACSQTGYKGRVAIHELLVINDEIRELIARRASEHSIRDAGRRAGMTTLMDDGLAKATEGITTLAEVLRVAPPDETATATAAPVAIDPGVPVAAGPPVGIDGAPVRVLVVEDSPTVSTVVKYFLELEGFAVTVAADGIEGLELARRERPHVIVSDVNMPGLDGISMVKALREDPLTRGVAILMLTSESSVETETRGLETGADDYILKPVEPRRLAARVRTLMTRFQARMTAAS